jgi:hypothetical protein
MQLGKEGGRPCYILCGNNVTYDPDLENFGNRKQLNRIGIDDNQSSVSALTAFGGKRSTSKLPMNKQSTYSNNLSLNNSFQPNGNPPFTHSNPQLETSKTLYKGGGSRYNSKNSRLISTIDHQVMPMGVPDTAHNRAMTPLGRRP